VTGCTGVYSLFLYIANLRVQACYRPWPALIQPVQAEVLRPPLL